MIKIIVGLPLIPMAWFLSFVFGDHARTIDDFKLERVRYSKVYIGTYGLSRRYHYIEIVSDGGKYTIPSHEAFIPGGMTLESIANLLSGASEALIWVDGKRNSREVLGIQTEHLNIPPSQGINYINNGRRWAWGGALVCLAASIFAYLYFKRYFGLDWKLNFKRYQSAIASRPRSVHIDHKRRRSNQRIRR